MSERMKNILIGSCLGFFAGTIFFIGAITSGVMQARVQRRYNLRLDALEVKLEKVEKSLAVLASAGRAAPPEDMNKVYKIDAGSSPVMGRADAPVTITMFADFQCPYCSKFYDPLLDALKAYPDKVKFIIKNLPLTFHPNSMPAALAALAAGKQGKYFDMVKLLMANKGDASPEKLKEYILALKLNEKKFFAALKDDAAEFKKQIAQDQDLAKRCDVRGTPTFFLNGKKVRAAGVGAWKELIDQALSDNKK